MAKQITCLLDDEQRDTLRLFSRVFGCSVSHIIRTAIRRELRRRLDEAPRDILLLIRDAEAQNGN